MQYSSQKTLKVVSRRGKKKNALGTEGEINVVLQPRCWVHGWIYDLNSDFPPEQTDWILTGGILGGQSEVFSLR